MLPGIVHAVNQPEHESPNVLVLTPTRELATQVYTVSLDACDQMGVKIGLVYGGDDRHRQIMNCRGGEWIFSFAKKINFS